MTEPAEDTQPPAKDTPPYCSTGRTLRTATRSEQNFNPYYGPVLLTTAQSTSISQSPCSGPPHFPRHTPPSRPSGVRAGTTHSSPATQGIALIPIACRAPGVLVFSQQQQQMYDNWPYLARAISYLVRIYVRDGAQSNIGR